MQSIKVGGLLVAVQLAEVLAAPAEMLAYLLNAKNEVKPLLKRYSEILSKPKHTDGIEIDRVERICVENLSYEMNELKILGNIQESRYTGHVLVNGIELEEIADTSFYEKVAVVFQEPYLFWTSLRENIVMGRAIREEDYKSIIEKLNLTYLLERFENQELTEESVANLSGGEKQRIALARAMVGKPQVYLLDEITSSLDAQNAFEIEKMLLEEDAMMIYACHKIVPELHEKYEVITL